MIVRPTLGPLAKSRSFRGQPLAIILVVFALWIGLRASFWLPTMKIDEVALVPLTARSDRHHETWAGDPLGEGSVLPSRGGVAAFDTLAVTGSRLATTVIMPMAPTRLASQSFSHLFSTGGMQTRTLQPARSPALVGEVRPSPWNREQSTSGTATFSLLARPDRANEPRRFSVDGWLFLRDGGGPDAGALPLAPTYGKSQFGAVLRYDLGSRTAHLPQAYLRATGAIDSREADLAAGFSIRPLPALPLRAHGEVRLSRLGERVELRPSAFVTAGIEETLPLDARVRGYAQAGYVGGEFATAFADGSLVVESVAKRFEHGALALGLGAWGGVQEGTERLDAGPTASMDLRVGGGTIRLAADYRFRVAGDAKPSSGAALTLSSSF